MKKFIMVDGKKIYIKDKNAEEALEKEEEESVEAEEEVGVEEEEDVKEEIESEAKKVAHDIAKDIISALKKDSSEKANKKVNNLIDDYAGNKVKNLLAKSVIDRKDVEKLTKEEKIVGFYNALVTNNVIALKALSEGTAADGGYLFPDEFLAELIKPLSEETRMRGLVRVIPMKRDVMKIPNLEDGPKVYWTAENETKTTTTAHFGEKTLTVKKMAAILYSSDELIEDSTEIDVVRTIIDLFAEAIGDEEDRVITVGNGTTEPTGFSGNITRTVTCAGNLDFDDLIELIYSLPQKYHRNSVMLSNRTNIKELRKLKDNDGRYLWNAPIAPGQPATFYGYPIYENNWLAEANIVFGDLKRGYYLGDRKRMTVKISQDTETAFTKDQTAIRVVSRIAGNIALQDALTELVSIP